MAGVLDSVNQRTQLVGKNRLELLTFRLNGPQIYGINVFKVREILQTPKLTEIPESHPVIRGTAYIRGRTIPVIDLALAMGGSVPTDIDGSFIVISEYNMTVQGFLVRAVERIINMNWEDILPPPSGLGNRHYLTSITRFENRLIEILDVEKILSEVAPRNDDVSEEIVTKVKDQRPEHFRVLIVDDSSVARKQIKRAVEAVGAETVLLNDGAEAYRHLLELNDQGINVAEHYYVLISDVEMPEMDGYTLTAKIRSNSDLKDLYVMLHTSLSGVFNQSMVDKVGADDFLAKFQPDVLAERVLFHKR
ncbi:chemotaxis protein CheV [Pokkaliibacter sp. MBI-7]|uniref:Chemotaxis protein CheW n=1 Tax=Proteobacteria bacterium 228 TaxID=2083153 RepID=A0A2S5KP39_9PROT|nr:MULTISPECIES: chemotaxis protein CheV [Pokkaliibacter]MDH2436084.1 chemotaxis protein CheV [Pokkaliibacter sp. MBI-7]PPC76500.1 chemotaxis protein CheW [Pokkaliibacter plantistimulans]